MNDIKLNEMDDKEAIKSEEREKMLNKENARDSAFLVTNEKIKEDVEKVCKDVEIVKTGEVEKMKRQLEESQKEIGIRVPIGGIKIPGFLKSLSKDKNKDIEGQGTDSDVEPPCVAQNVRKQETKDSQEVTQRQLIAKRFKKIINRMPLPAAKREEGSENIADSVQNDTKDENTTHSKKQNLIDSIKIPLISVLPKKFTREAKEPQKDMEMGTAGLASMETLEDSKESNGLMEDGMETVKLDGDDAKDAESQDLSDKSKQGVLGSWNFRDWKEWPNKFKRTSRHEKAILAALILFILLIIIFIFLILRARAMRSPPLKDGRYIVTASSCGPVEGLYEDRIFKFLGIPYAVPPTGIKRWEYAEPLNQLEKCWNGTLKAHNSTPTCWQIYMKPNGKWRIDGSEDCLSLDIYTPYVRYDIPRPVVVLIDTATLVGGSPGILKPTPKIILSKEVVFVRPNFRLGVFGFLAVNALSKANQPPTSGNYGLSDIITALKWVKLNIINFGGDPNMITVVGHRAGATLVTALVSSHSAKNLFNRAWASSGSVIYPEIPLQLSEQANQRYVDQICSKKPDKLQCLKSYDAEELIEELDDSWRPTVSDLPSNKEVGTQKHEWLVLDGKILMEGLWKEENQHTFLVLGTTAHSEASPQLWEKLQKIPGSKEEAIVQHVKDSYVGALGLTDEVLGLYNTTWEGLTAMITDIRMICPMLNFTRVHAQQNISFYVAKLERNHTDFGQIADVDADMSSILGTYEPRTFTQKKFVSTIQDLFYTYVSQEEWLPKKRNGVLIVSKKAEWQDDYPNCNYWSSKNLVPQFARKD